MRSIILSNGNICVNLDDKGRLRDFYYPYVGSENHVMGHLHRLGIWINGKFSWLADDIWRSSVHYKKGTMIGESKFTNEEDGVVVTFEDAVDTNKNIFLRRIKFKNNTDQFKDVRLFFCHEFLISEHKLANTAFFDPERKALIHYKGRRVFLINGLSEMNKQGFDDYTTGVWGFNGNEGSFHDCEDGVLNKSTVDHGPADSVGALYTKLDSQDEDVLYYWICVGKTIEEATVLNDRVLKRKPEQIIDVSENFWKAWVNKRKRNFYDLSDTEIDLFNRSLLIVRAHFDNRGGVIASSDSDRLSYGKEGYTFVWPRDGALAAMAMDNAGYSEVTRPFFEFMAEVITPDGYIHHKFLPDRSLGSTWHSSVRQKKWLEEEKMQLPIQEDETASVIFSLWNHYNQTRDIEMAERMYEKLIYPAGKFMMRYRDEVTFLPKESYDLWEEKLGLATYTASSVYGGLSACSKFANLLGKGKHAEMYIETAKEVRESIKKYLFSKTRNAFIRTAYYKDKGKFDYEEIIDASSLYSLWFYNVLPCDDSLFLATEKAVEKNLKNVAPIGGIIRYENDEYFRHGNLSNPWFITTLWEIQLKIKKSKSIAELRYAIKGLDWILKHTTSSGILAEQLDAETGQPLCVSPLTWSHSTYVDTIVLYLNKMENLSS